MGNFVSFDFESYVIDCERSAVSDFAEYLVSIMEQISNSAFSFPKSSERLHRISNSITRGRPQYGSVRLN